MTPTTTGMHEDGYQVRHDRCPLLAPVRTGESCAHAQFAGGGCRKRINLEAGGKIRIALDRRSDPFTALYRQRTATERINSQATSLGIERPIVRRAAGVRRINTLIYIVINANALTRFHQRTSADQATTPSLC